MFVELQQKIDGREIKSAKMDEKHVCALQEAIGVCSRGSLHFPELVFMCSKISFLQKSEPEPEISEGGRESEWCDRRRQTCSVTNTQAAQRADRKPLRNPELSGPKNSKNP